MDALKELGLTESEQKVYFALLDLGDSTRGKIVDKSGVSGSKVYEILDKLQKKGLSSTYIKNKIMHFKPTNPKQLLNYIEDKKNQLRLVEEQTILNLPSLINMYANSQKEQEVELLVGLKGLQILFQEQVEILSSSDCCYVIGGTKGSDEGVVQSFFEKIHIMREDKNIKTKMLFNRIQKESTDKIYSSDKFPLTETKYIMHSSPVAINIYKNRTIIIIFGKQINSIYIKSQEVADSFIEYFKILWESSN